jgi:hypothetical protein
LERFPARWPQPDAGPQFTISVVLVSGAGIEVAISMFSLVNAYRFRPAPVKDGNNLITLASQGPRQQHLSNVSS